MEVVLASILAYGWPLLLLLGVNWLLRKLLDSAFWRYVKRQNAPLRVFLQLQEDTKTRVELPLELRLADLNRAELLARLAMLPLHEPYKGLSLEYLSTRDFLRQINEVAGAQGDLDFVIPATQAEFDQFDLPEKPILPLIMPLPND